MILLAQDIYIFRIYIIGILVFLVLICFRLGIDVFQTMYINFLLYKNNNISDLYDLNNMYIHSLINLLIKTKQWLLSISILELCDKKKFLKDSFVNEVLGFCYENLSYANIAEYYYLKSLYYSPDSLQIMSRLFYFYKKNNDIKKIENICYKILSIDSGNELARKYIAKYIK